MSDLKTITLRLLIARHPCLQCQFALATHARFDPMFGLSIPRFCAAHAAEANAKGEDWRICPDDAYSPLSQEAITALELTQEARTKTITAAWFSE
jgi:hypothetical protein